MLVPSHLDGLTEGHQPGWDLDPEDVHLRPELHPVSADGTLEAQNASAHGLSLRQ